MKNYAKQKLCKKIIISLVIVLLCNFSFSNIVFAGNKDLMNPIASFFCAIGDITIALLQKNLQGTPAIRFSGEDEFSIKYSPGVILSGTLPVFNINFIEKPVEDTEKYIIKVPEEVSAIKTTAITSFYKEDNENIVFYKTINSIGVNILDEVLNLVQNPDNITDEDKQLNFENDLIDKNHVIDYAQTLQRENRYNDDKTTQKIENTDMSLPENPEVYSTWLLEDGDEIIQYRIYISHRINENDNPRAVTQIYEVKLTKTVLEKQAIIASIAKILRNTIASWYRAMQEIALVGLLLVLVYMSIRMIIDSSTRRKSKIQKNAF